MPEVTIPAPSAEAVRAAVQNGADAVYISSGILSDRALADVIKYCRIRGVKVYFTLPDSVREAEFTAVLSRARRAVERGADAIETGDLGVLRALRSMLPDFPLHFSSGAASAAAAATAACLGASRVILSPFLSRDELHALCSASKVELELPCHGPLGAGPGAFAAFSRSGLPLASRDLCLAGELQGADLSGLAALRVLGSDRRAEYSALTAAVYSAAAKGLPIDSEKLPLLERAFSPAGMSPGFFSDKTPSLFAAPGSRPQSLPADIRDSYMHSEADLVPVRLAGMIAKDRPVQIYIRDRLGNSASAQGDPPREAFGSESTSQVQLRTHLHNLVNSPFYCEEAMAEVGRGLYVPPAEIIALRKKAIAGLCEKRAAFSPPAMGEPPAITPGTQPITEPDINISVSRAAQLSPELAGLKPELLYVPIAELLEHPGNITPFWENGVTSICAALPHCFHDGRDGELIKRLDELRQLQINDILANELGQIFTAAARGFRVHAGSGLCVRNSQAVHALGRLRCVSATASPELSFGEISALSKELPMEAVLYGRLPLLRSEADISADLGTELLRGRRSSFPILSESSGFSAVFSPEKLFLARKKKEYDHIGLWCARLDFTTESAEECVLIAQRFLGQNRHIPSGASNGFYC